MKMKQYAALVLLAATVCTECAFAQQDGEQPFAGARYFAAQMQAIVEEFPNYSEYSFSEHALEWNEFKKKKARGLVMNDHFLLENKGVSPSIYTITELPVSTTGEFVETAVIEVEKFDKKTSYTFYMNAEDDQNCTAVTFNAQSVRAFHLKDGRPGGEQSSVLNFKKGLKQILIVVKKVNGTVTLSINGDECIKFRKINLTSAGIGFAALPKQSIKILAVGAGSKNPEEE